MNLDFLVACTSPYELNGLAKPLLGVMIAESEANPAYSFGEWVTDIFIEDGQAQFNQSVDLNWGEEQNPLIRLSQTTLLHPRRKRIEAPFITFFGSVDRTTMELVFSLPDEGSATCELSIDAQCKYVESLVLYDLFTSPMGMGRPFDQLLGGRLSGALQIASHTHVAGTPFDMPIPNQTRQVLREVFFQD